MTGNNPRSISYLKVSEKNFRPGCPITQGEWVAMSANILDLKIVRRHQESKSPIHRDVQIFLLGAVRFPTFEQLRVPTHQNYFNIIKLPFMPGERE